MLEITMPNDLSFYNEKGNLVVSAKQYDTARIFEFNIVDRYSEVNLTDCDVYLRVLRSDGIQVQFSECCSINDTIVTVDTSIGTGKQLLTSPGDNKCELHFTNRISGKELTTWTFYILVEERVHDGTEIDISGSGWDRLDDLIKDYEQYGKDLELLSIRFKNHEIYSLTEPKEEQVKDDYWYETY